MGQGGFGSPNDRLGIGLIGVQISECGALYSTVNQLGPSYPLDVDYRHLSYQNES